MKLLSLVFLSLAALMLLACDGDESPTATATPTASPSPVTTLTPRATPTATSFQGTRGPIEVPGRPAPPVMTLTHVRAASQQEFDRVVFQFEGGRPGYRIEYVQPPILADASGLPVQITGAAFLRARFSPAAAHNESGQLTFDKRELTPNLRSMLELELTGDFEAVLTWVIGLRQAVDFKVTELENPTRIVIDIAQP